MTVRILKAHPSGSAYLYHSSINPDGSTNEHFFLGRVRQTPKANITYCHLCDSVTVMPRANGDEHARAVEAMALVRVLHADGVPFDPLVAAREDGVAGIPSPNAPQDTAGRKALRETLRAAHVNVRP